MTEEENICVQCPNCLDYVIIEKINCGIFRHAYFKNNFEQIPPHTDKETCDFFVEKNMVLGCSKPFRIVYDKNSKKYISEKCDYV